MQLELANMNQPAGWLCVSPSLHITIRHSVSFNLWFVAVRGTEVVEDEILRRADKRGPVDQQRVHNVNFGTSMVP